MRIGFIGAGRVGTAFGAYLRQKGFVLSGYSSRTEASGVLAAHRTQSSYFKDMEQLAAVCDLLFITTSDDEISSAADRLCRWGGLRAGQMIAHMSGALSSEILSPVKTFGCFTYSLHPLQAFADIDKAIADLSNISFCLEGDQEKLFMLEGLLQKCNNTYFLLKPDQKPLYHASACMLSNYLVTLIHNGLKLMEGTQLDQAAAYKAMLPLIESTLRNVLEFGTAEALTGPIARGDIGTVASQLAAVSTSCSEQLELYALMSRETVKLAELSKLKDRQASHKLEALIESYI